MRTRFIAARIGGTFLIVTAQAVLATKTASAGGFYSPYQSSTAIGAAFAGAAARSDDASFFFYNPAAISDLRGPQSFTDLRVFIPTAKIDVTHAASPAGTVITGDGGSGNLADSAAAPGSVSTIPIGYGLTIGIGSSAHFASDVEAPNSAWAGRFHLLQSRIVGANVTGAVSWQAAPWLAVAVGVQVERMETKFTSAALIPLGLAPPIEARAYLAGTDWATGSVAGIMIKPTSSTHIGISWRSALTHDIEGEAGAFLDGVPREAVRYDVNLPQTLAVGLEHRVSEALRLFAEVQWVDWSRFKGFDISFASGRPNEVRPITWEDTWLGAVGFGLKVAPETEITAGVSYDTAASPNGSGSTLSPDANKLMVGLGLIHDLPAIGRMSFNYAHVFVEEAPVRASNAAAGTLEGTLDAALDIFSASYTFAW